MCAPPIKYNCSWSSASRFTIFIRNFSLLRTAKVSDGQGTSPLHPRKRCVLLTAIKRRSTQSSCNFRLNFCFFVVEKDSTLLLESAYLRVLFFITICFYNI